MLHIAVISHGPETCAAVEEELKEIAQTGIRGLSATAGEHGAKFEGGWVDMAAHRMWLLIDAPNAHAVSQLTMDHKIFHWNTVTVHPVITLDEARERAALN